MQIKCQATKRFLFKIDIESYYEAIKSQGLDITLPLIIEIPCQRCKMIEVYEIYPTHYLHIRSYKKDK